MRTIHHQVNPSATRDEVVDIVERYKIPALPVVNQNNFLLGVITYEDVVEALEDLTDETFARMAGTAEDVGENEPTVKRFFSRAPWLIVTLCAGLLSVTVISFSQHFQGDWFISLLFVVPLVTAMSGNVGIQCSTVLVRGIATGMVSMGQRADTVIKELLIGLLTGTIFGLLGGLFVFAFNILETHIGGPSPFIIAVIVSMGIFGACLTATLLGVFSPFFFARIGIDPAVAAGPIVTAFNDVLSTIMYILIAFGVSSLVI
jgi:magnesium transporter